jgi:hypothetical protein
LRLIDREPCVEIGEPLGVDKRFEDSLYFECGGLAFALAGGWLQLAQETEFDDLVYLRVDLVNQFGFVAA